MSSKRQVPVPITDSLGQEWGKLQVYLLPKTDHEHEPFPLLDYTGDPDRNPNLEPIQLLEGIEYRYRFEPREPLIGVLTTDRPEIFQADEETGLSGRLRPSLYVGSLPVQLLAGDQVVGHFALEVRSRKFEYLDHYRWMLRDIAEGLAEVVMQRFAPTEQRFRLDGAHDAPTLYQRFTFLKTIISGDRFEAAMQQIFARPHRAWIAEEELRPTGQRLPSGAALARQITGPGPRLPWPGAPAGSRLQSLPVRVAVQHHEETLDTPENRFVKFALIRWRETVAEIERALLAQADGHPVVRGLREVRAVVDQLDRLLAADLFREVGRLTQFPAGSQVLQKRAGYRDLFAAYVQFDAAATLTWEGGEDVYKAGQRNVAALYEYWVFLQLATTISSLCQVPFDPADLLEPSTDGLGLVLRRGKEKTLQGSVTRLGRRFKLELYYNKLFGRGQKGATTWTRPMQPDCSLSITLDPPTATFSEEVWLHFDAKYRVEELVELFSDTPIPDDDEMEPLATQKRRVGKATRDDLLKMHAYRDAIRRSAGAYVIYPGSEVKKQSLYHEILPGLGAFAVRPVESGRAEGIGAVKEFIQDVLDHLASQATQHERSRFWVREAWDDSYRVERPLPAVPFVKRPPADTLVLLGWVKGEKHLNWIHKHMQYNMRGDERQGGVELGSRELAADLVVLYGSTLVEPEVWLVSGRPMLYTRERMLDLDYPIPGGDLYYCLPLQPLPSGDWAREILTERLREACFLIRSGPNRGKPMAMTWLELAR